MRTIAAYLLAVLGGKESPSAADVTKILESVGISVDAAQTAKIVSELEGKSLDELIAAGTKKMSSVPSGGASSGGAAPAAAGGAAAAAEKPKEKSEESEADMGFSLFD